tara:strand:+ start:6182 stop:6751 length:570 start_codon:yes stop_codon:yes gene_type:complete
MAKRALARKPEKRERIIDLVVLWKSTPENMRKHKSLSELAKANDLTPNTDFYSIANSPEVMMKVTTSIAGEELNEVKNVLAVLRDQAKTGHVRSAEVYLEWIRKIITDSSLMEYVKPATDMNRTLKEISNGAQQMLKVAEKLKDHNDIDTYLQSKAVTADYQDTAPMENKKLSQTNGQATRPSLDKVDR